MTNEDLKKIKELENRILHLEDINKISDQLIIYLENLIKEKLK